MHHVDTFSYNVRTGKFQLLRTLVELVQCFLIYPYKQPVRHGFVRGWSSCLLWRHCFTSLSCAHINYIPVRTKSQCILRRNTIHFPIYMPVRNQSCICFLALRIFMRFSLCAEDSSLGFPMRTNLLGISYVLLISVCLIRRNVSGNSFASASIFLSHVGLAVYTVAVSSFALKFITTSCSYLVRFIKSSLFFSSV